MKLDKLKRIIKEGLHDMSIIWANEMKMTVKDEAVLIFFLLASTIYPFLYSYQHYQYHQNIHSIINQ